MLDGIPVEAVVPANHILGQVDQQSGWGQQKSFVWPDDWATGATKRLTGVVFSKQRSALETVHSQTHLLGDGEHRSVR